MKNLLLLLLISLAISSCSKSKFQEIEYETLNLNGCYSIRGEHIIQTKSEYEAFLAERMRFQFLPSCANFEAPEVDFDIHTLLIKNTGESSSTTIEKEICYDEKEDILYVNFTFLSPKLVYGDLMECNHTFIIPKVDANTTIHFTETRKRVKQ